MEFVANGADIVWISADDVNKTFAITFRTLPDDDTGVAHIVEHSVLCGSEKFPVKSPFEELRKSSLATFLNAFTASDFTCYPVSTCNDQDLLNLAEVYLDAVFAPLSLKNDWAMPQERSIVFNEMKGVMSSPDSIGQHGLSRLLFPANTYGRVSGGDLAAIPSLTGDQYRAFYDRFYHPSNARVFLYGKIDLMPMLKLVGSYLGQYQRRDVPPLPLVQQPVAAEKIIEYPSDTIPDRTRLCEGWVFGSWRDVEKFAAMYIACDYLAGSNDAPLAMVLLDSGLCDDMSLGCIPGFQNVISASLVNVRDGRIDETRRIFREALERLVRAGFDKEQIAARLDRYEFMLRERDHFIETAGFKMFMEAIACWRYGGDPAEWIEFSSRIESLRAKNGTGYYERLIAEAILENPHHATLVLKPTDKPKAEVVAPSVPSAKAPDDDPADLASLPRLRLADIPEEGEFTTWNVDKIDGVEVVRPNVVQNGITYATLSFLVNDLTESELLDLSLLARVLGKVPAGGRDVPTLNKELKSRLGSFSASAYGCRSGGCIMVDFSFLPRKAEDTLCLIKDILVASDFSLVKEVEDIRRQMRIDLENGLLSSGVSIAKIRASRALSEECRVKELFGGLSQLRHLKCGTCGNLAKLAAKVFVRGRLVVSIANQPFSGFDRRLIGIVPEGGTSGRAEVPLSGEVAPSDGFPTKGQGAFTAMCARLPDGIAYSGVCRLAAKIITRDFLHNEIRVKGGAYGASCSVDRMGNIRFSSWNDPRPSDTFKVFARCGAASREFVKSGQSLDGYKVSLSNDESNMSVMVKALLAFVDHLDGVSCADRQRWRSEMLHANTDDLLWFADILDRALPNATCCAIGEDSLVKGFGLLEFGMESQPSCAADCRR